MSFLQARIAPPTVDLSALLARERELAANKDRQEQALAEHHAMSRRDRKLVDRMRREIDELTFMDRGKGQ